MCKFGDDVFIISKLSYDDTIRGVLSTQYRSYRIVQSYDGELVTTPAWVLLAHKASGKKNFRTQVFAGLSWKTLCFAQRGLWYSGARWYFSFIMWYSGQHYAFEFCFLLIWHSSAPASISKKKTQLLLAFASNEWTNLCIQSSHACFSLFSCTLVL